MIYTFFDKNTGSWISVNEQLAEELHKKVIQKNSKEETYMRDLKITFRRRFSWNEIIVFKEWKC